MQKVVWVLGAGFSRSLNGPLLQNFFSPRRLKDLRLRYSEEQFPKLTGPFIGMIPDLFQLGKIGDKTSVASLWADAEEFLDYLDLVETVAPETKWSECDPTTRPAEVTHVLSMAGQLNTAAAGKNTMKEDAKRIHAAARRLMAAECTVFLEGQNTKLEKWQPYWAWLRLVQPTDWIITFNYDTLVERLFEDSAGHGFSEPPIVVLEPGRRPSEYSNRALMLKLHGSVDWKAAASGYKKTADRRFALGCEDPEVCIASPGSNKLTQSAAGLKPLWDVLPIAFENADAIVFIGYRFPPSDAHARGTLLNAISLGCRAGAEVKAHIVLTANSSDAPRTSRMLTYAIKRNTRLGMLSEVIVQPLSAEDFLTVVSREQLFARI